MKEAPLDDANSTIITLDVEASGFGRGSYPIEIGVTLANGDCLCTLIEPEEEWVHWDEAAQALHGITREALTKYGKPVKVVAQWLNAQLAEKVVYSDAWGNDSSWLGVLYNAAEIPQHFKLESIRSILSDSQIALWHSVKDELQAKYSGRRHRASNDAKLIQRTWSETLSLANHL